MRGGYVYTGRVCKKQTDGRQVTVQLSSNTSNLGLSVYKISVCKTHREPVPCETSVPNELNHWW